jgi:hypothetical protein
MMGSFEVTHSDPLKRPLIPADTLKRAVVTSTCNGCLLDDDVTHRTQVYPL